MVRTEFSIEHILRSPCLTMFNLADMYGYKKSDITILMDDGSGKYAEPTRENMVRASFRLHKLLARVLMQRVTS